MSTYNEAMQAGMTHELLKVDLEARDGVWERSFLKSLSDTPLKVLSPDAQEGPDHWPYLLAAIDADGDDNLQNVVSWLSTKGIGLVLNPSKPMPDFVLSYGMIWNFRERGEFMTELPSSEVGRFEIRPGQKLWTGAPSEQYLPRYVRSILKQFLAAQGVFAPKVLMVNFAEPSDSAPSESSGEGWSGYDLCFSIESLKSPPQHEHANIAEALGWFLPTHYKVSLVSERVVPGFGPLVQS